MTRNACATWNKIEQFDATKQGLPTDIYFLDGKTGFLGFGNDATPIWMTSDSGVTWNPAITPSALSGYVSDIWFSAPQDGWATIAGGGSSGMLWHSTDGGNSWSVIKGFHYYDPSSVRKPSTALCISGSTFGVEYSLDNAATFTQSFNAQMRGLDYVDNLHLVSTPSINSLHYYYSSDGGISWLAVPSVGGDSWGVLGIKGTSTYFVAPEDRIKTTTPSSVFRSADYGATWGSVSTLSFKTTGDIEGNECAIFVQNSDSLRGQPLGIFRSTDEGVNWTSIGGPSNSMDSRFAVLNGGLTIYAFDETDGLWKTTDGGDGSTGLGKSSLALDTSTINLGNAIACHTHDTEIAYTNTGCTQVNIDSWTMSQWSTGFNVTGTGQSPQINLKPGQSDSLHITYTSGSGHIYDTVIVTSDASNGPVWRIPVEINITPQDSIRFIVSVNPDPIKPGDTLTVTVSPEKAAQDSGLRSISGTLDYRSDSYNFISASGGAGSAQFQSTHPFVEGKTAQIPFTISSVSDISLDAAAPILTVRLRAMLSDTSVSSIVLDSLLLNGSDQNFGDCILGAISEGAVSHILLGCGDTLLMLEMQGKLTLDVENPVPNPLTSEAGYQSSLSLHSDIDGVAEVRVTDMLGRMVAATTIVLSAGESANYPLDLSRQPAGAYFYTVEFASQSGISTKSGTVMVLR